MEQRRSGLHQAFTRGRKLKPSGNGLDIAYTYADVVLELNQIEASIEREAIMLEDIYRDLDRYGSPRAVRARSLVHDYLEAVIEYDWPALANDRLSEEAPLFLVVVVFGFLITMVCFGPHDPNRLTLVLLSFYTLLIGLVIYLILAYSDPFQGSTGIEPASLKYILQQMKT